MCDVVRFNLHSITLFFDKLQPTIRYCYVFTIRQSKIVDYDVMLPSKRKEKTLTK